MGVTMLCDTKMREGRHRGPVQLLPAAAQCLRDVQEERTAFLGQEYQEFPQLYPLMPAKEPPMT